MAKKSQIREASGPEIESLESAREVLRSEAAAIKAVSDSIGPEFHAAVSLIRELRPGGRLVLLGMGKAGFIAQKVSATFASTGIPSFFLHPAEATHGDLGRFSKGDVALILSNSGETPELNRIIPLIKRFGCPIISITATSESTLGKHSEVVLEIGVVDEAGPHGVAPTTSTAVMLALGDALSMTVFQQHGFSREQFALYHPGGSIGRSLMVVSEIMRTGDENCIVPETMLAKDVLHKISATKNRPGAAAIVDNNGILAGVFTDGNLRRCLESGAAFLEAPISGVMTKNPKVITAERLVTEALRMLTEYKIDQVIVVDAANRPIGLIDIQDLVEFRGTAQ